MFSNQAGEPEIGDDVAMCLAHLNYLVVEVMGGAVGGGWLNNYSVLCTW